MNTPFEEKVRFHTDHTIRQITEGVRLEIIMAGIIADSAKWGADNVKSYEAANVKGNKK
jgi:hypothetical protein